MSEQLFTAVAQSLFRSTHSWPWFFGFMAIGLLVIVAALLNWKDKSKFKGGFRPLFKPQLQLVIGIAICLFLTGELIYTRQKSNRLARELVNSANSNTLVAVLGIFHPTSQQGMWADEAWPGLTTFFEASEQTGEPRRVIVVTSTAAAKGVLDTFSSYGVTVRQPAIRIVKPEADAGSNEQTF